MIVFVTRGHPFELAEYLQSETPSVLGMPHMVCMLVDSPLSRLHFTLNSRILRCIFRERQGKQLLLSFNCSWREIKSLCTSLPLTKNTRQARCENSLCVCKKPILLNVSFKFWEELGVGCV